MKKYKKPRLLLSQIASASVGTYTYSCHPGMSNWEQKIVEAVWFLASMISSRFLASASFSGYSSHSSRIRICSSHIVTIKGDSMRKLNAITD